MKDHPKRQFWYIYCLVILVILSGCAKSKERVKSSETTEGMDSSPVKITDIQGEALNDKVRITIASSDNLNYTAFTLSDPLRLVLDLPDAQLKNYKEPIPIYKGSVLNVVPIQLPKEGSRVNSRIEIELAKQVRYQVLTDQNKLYVDLENGVEEVAAKSEEVITQLPESKPEQPPDTQPVSAQVDETAPAKDSEPSETPSESAEAKPPVILAKTSDEIKLTRVKEVEISQLQKETRVIIISDVLPEYEVKKESDPPRVVLDLKKSTIAPGAQKITDVHLTPSSIKRISAFQLKRSPTGDDNLVRVVLNLTQPVDPQVKTEDGKIIIDVAHSTQMAEAGETAKEPAKPEGEQPEGTEIPVSELPTAQTPSIRTPQTVEEAKYRGQPITLDFKDADIRDVLRIIAEINDFNLVLHPDVSGRVTVRLINVPWDQALDIVLKLNNLAVEIDGNIMRVGSSASFQKEIEARRVEQEQRLAAIETQKKLEPLRTEIITLNFADPSQIISVIDGVLSGRREGGQALQRRGTITTDTRTKTLIIQDTDENIRLIKELVAKLDKRTPQILIEARIVTVNKQFSKSLGINWSGSFAADAAHGNTTGFRFPNSATGNFAINLPLGDNVGSTGIRLGSIDDVFSLDLNLAAAETEGRATILSQPKVVTVDNKAASIQTGVTFTLATTILVNNTTQTTLQQINATLSLNVTPRVSADGHILMTVNAQNNSPDFSSPITTSGGVPPINTQSVNTEVLVKDGETVVLGGILQTNTSKQLRAVPYLHKIPVVGRVFRSTIPDTKNQAELLIFITPKLLNTFTVEQGDSGAIKQLSVQ
jgi:type IV pilus assembly protein PilQ